MIHVDPNWWQWLFDEVYLLTDAPFVCNPELTRREVEVVEQALHLCKADRILDLCGGQGRHALELARRGYRHLTVLDYAEFLLQRGRRKAAETGLQVAFQQGDARTLYRSVREQRPPMDRAAISISQGPAAFTRSSAWTGPSGKAGSDPGCLRCRRALSR